MADEKDTAEKAPARHAPPPKAAPPSAGAQADAAARGPRTGGVTDAGHAEYEALGVNPKLDNRVGDQRPHEAEFAPKPQQFDGPVVGGGREHAEVNGPQFAELFGRDEAARGAPVGNSAEGPHGRGEV